MIKKKFYYAKGGQYFEGGHHGAGLLRVMGGRFLVRRCMDVRECLACVTDDRGAGRLLHAYRKNSEILMRNKAGYDNIGRIELGGAFRGHAQRDSGRPPMAGRYHPT